MAGQVGPHRSIATGLDRLLDSPDRWLRGRRFGLVTSAVARTSTGTPGYRIVAKRLTGLLESVFAPEHGLEATLPAGDGVSAGCLASGVPVYSLYDGTRFSPTSAMLKGLELLVFDLQDIGARYFTYAATMVECLVAAAGVGIPLLILDRPNPLGGLAVEGPGVESGFRSLVGPLDTPVRHGLTVAELARLATIDLGLSPETVETVPMLGWDRAMIWHDTGLTWYPPSPGARSFAMARLYPGTCLVEGVNVSEGRGTDAPFELVGAPWIDGEALARGINGYHGLPGTKGWPWAVPVQFTPRASKYAGQECRGVRLEPPEACDATAGRGLGMVAFGLALLSLLAETYPEQLAWVAPTPEAAERRFHIDLLAGGTWLRKAVDERSDVGRVVSGWCGFEAAYRERAAEALLYNPAAWREEGAAAASARFVPKLSPGNRLGLDQMPGIELGRVIARSAADAVAAVLVEEERLGNAIDLAVERLAGGGRLVYVGAGTSGRLGALDASECEPTFGIPRDRVVALLAGGPAAMTRSQEGAEDDEEAARSDIAGAGVGAADVVVAIAASGTTPYTVAALREARSRGALGIAVLCAPGTPLAAVADVAIEAITGGEPLKGSTRLKAGTAQKVVLNALSTGVFARLGYVYGDLMVGVQTSNDKLRIRAVGIVRAVTGVVEAQAQAALAAAIDHNPRLAVRLAILTLLTGLELEAAERLLGQSGESLRRAIAAARKE